MEEDGPHKADAALVLGGDEGCTRIMRAGELAREGYVPIVYVSGPPIFDRHESEFTIGCAVHRGFPPSLFRSVPDNCNSTRSEAKFFANFLRAQGVHTLLLVTSNFHTRRAAKLLRAANPGMKIWVTGTSGPDFPPEWWMSRDGQRTFLLEWTKTVNTWLGN